MPLPISADRSTILIRKAAFERAGLQRSAIDARFNLTDAEFHVEGELIAVGPLPSDDMLGEMITAFEEHGLVYYDDFFELSGNWPEWLAVYVTGSR